MKRPGEEKPTRLALLRARRRLARVQDGADLLRRKREALVRELLAQALPAVDARERIAEAAARAYPALLDALAEEGHAGVVASAEPLRVLTVDAESRRLWGLTLAGLTRTPTLARTLEARGTVPGPTAPSSIEAAEAFETLAQLLIEAAPQEMLLRRLGRAVSRTSRQVRALERRVEPALTATVSRLAGLLEEREREEHTRLRLFLRARRRTLAAARGGRHVRRR